MSGAILTTLVRRSGCFSFPVSPHTRRQHQREYKETIPQPRAGGGAASDRHPCLVTYHAGNLVLLELTNV